MMTKVQPNSAVERVGGTSLTHGVGSSWLGFNGASTRALKRHDEYRAPTANRTSVILEDHKEETLAAKSWDEIREVVTKALGDCYVDLLGKYGRSLWDSDKFHVCFVHAVCNLAVSMKMQGADLTRRQQTEFYRRIREMTVDNMLVIAYLRTGKAPANTTDSICAVVDEFMRDPAQPNPFARDIQAMRHLIDGMTALFAGEESAIDEMVAGASLGYDALCGQRAKLEIDTMEAARDFSAAFMDLARGIDANTADAETYLLQEALSCLAIVTAAHVINARQGVLDSDSAWTLLFQVWQDASIEYLPELDFDQADKLLDSSDRLNMAEAHNMLMSLMMEEDRMKPVVSAVNAGDSRWKTNEWRERFSASVEGIGSWYWKNLAQVRKASH